MWVSVSLLRQTAPHAAHQVMSQHTGTSSAWGSSVGAGGGCRCCWVLGASARAGAAAHLAAVGIPWRNRGGCSFGCWAGFDSSQQAAVSWPRACDSTMAPCHRAAVILGLQQAPRKHDAGCCHIKPPGCQTSRIGQGLQLKASTAAAVVVSRLICQSTRVLCCWILDSQEQTQTTVSSSATQCG